MGILDRLREPADNYTGLQGSMVCNAVGGDAGSCLGFLMLEFVPVDYGRKICFTVWACPQVATAVNEYGPAGYLDQSLTKSCELWLVWWGLGLECMDRHGGR